MKKDLNLKVTAAALAAATTMATTAVPAAAKTVAKVSTCKNGSSISRVASTKKSSLELPIEVLMLDPNGFKKSSDGSLSWNYVPVEMEYNSKSLNPMEFEQIMKALTADGVSYNSKEKWVYNDTNKTNNVQFKKITSTKNLSINKLANYINDQDAKNAKLIEKIDYSKYANLILPVYEVYAYTNSNGKQDSASRIAYINFAMPYDKLDNKANIMKYIQLAYACYYYEGKSVISYKDMVNMNKSGNELNLNNANKTKTK